MFAKRKASRFNPRFVSSVYLFHLYSMQSIVRRVRLPHELLFWSNIRSQALASLVDVSSGDLRKAINLLQSAQRMHPQGGDITHLDIVEVACVRLRLPAALFCLCFECRIDISVSRADPKILYRARFAIPPLRLCHPRSWHLCWRHAIAIFPRSKRQRATRFYPDTR